VNCMRKYVQSLCNDYLYIYGLFDVTISSSHYLALNGRMIHEWWTGKDVEGNGHGSNLRYYAGICLEGARKKVGVKIVSVLVDNLTAHHPNISQRC
jgi:hypothetical protein